MLHQITRPAREILLESLNRVNGTNFTHEDVEFTNPRPVIDPDFNSQLDLRAGSGNQFYDERTVRYNRIDLATFFARYRSRFSVSSGVQTLATVLPLIDAVYGCRLLEEDFEATSITVESGEPVTFTLRASPSSLLFFGEADLELRDYNAETPDPEPEPEPGLAFDFFSAIPPMGNNAYYDRGINYHVSGYRCSNDLQGSEDVQRLTGWMEYDYTGTYSCGESLNIEDSDFTPTDVAFSYYGGNVYLAREADLVSAIPEFNTNYEYLAGRIEARVNDQTKTYYGLFYNPFYNDAPEEPEEPTIEARGFFVSNPQRAALTSDFVRYASVDDTNAPKISPTHVATHASGANKQIVVFSAQSTYQRITVSVSDDGGVTWDRHLMPIRFVGLRRSMAATYFKGSYYLQLQEIMSGGASLASGNFTYGLFRLINTGTDLEPVYDFERIADIPTDTWSGQNHTLSDGDYLYAAGNVRNPSGGSKPFIYRTADLVNWESFYLGDDSGDVKAVKRLELIAVRENKIYLIGQNNKPQTNENYGSKRCSLGVFDLDNPTEVPSWYDDWPFDEPPLTTHDVYRRLSSLVVTDTHLILGTARNVFGEAVNEIGSIIARSTSDITAPWEIRRLDTGIEDLELAELEDRIIAFGKRATDREGAVSMLYSTDRDNGWLEWATVDEEDNIFNAYANRAYVAGFDEDLESEILDVVIPPAPDVELPSLFGTGGDWPPMQPMAWAVGPNQELYINHGGAYIAGGGTTNYGIYKTLPYDRTERSEAIDRTYQARLSRTAPNYTKITALSQIVALPDGSVYVLGSGTNTLYGWDGSTYQGGQRVIRLKPDGLYDPSFVLDPEVNTGLSITGMFLNRRGRLMVYSSSGGGNMTVNGTTPNNLVEIMPDGSVSTEFTSGIVRRVSQPSSMTKITDVFQLSNGHYLVKCDINGTHPPGEWSNAFLDESGNPLPKPALYSSADLQGVTEIKQPTGPNRVLVWGHRLNVNTFGSSMALFDLDLQNPYFLPYGHEPLVGIADVGGVCYGTVNDHEFVSVNNTGAYYVSTETWEMTQYVPIRGGQSVGIIDGDVLLTSPETTNEPGGIIRLGVFPREYPRWILGKVHTAKLPIPIQ